MWTVGKEPVIGRLYHPFLLLFEYIVFEIPIATTTSKLTTFTLKLASRVMLTCSRHELKQAAATFSFADLAISIPGLTSSHGKQFSPDTILQRHRHCILG